MQKDEEGCDNCRESCPPVEECEEGKSPIYDEDAPIICFSCEKPRKKVDDVKQCTIRPKNLRECRPDETPFEDPVTGCASCHPPRVPPCALDPATFPTCAPNQLPERDPTTGCNSCVLRVECTEEAREKCMASVAARVIAQCPPGVHPTIDPANCCPSCVPPPNACDETTEARCNEIYPQLPVCESVAELDQAWDADSCCFSCRRPDGNITVSDDECTKEQVENCLLNAPVCIDSGEKAYAKQVVDDSHCCDLCKRTQRQWGCTVLDVAACSPNLPECGDDQDPIWVEGDCCPSCKAPRRCSRSCSEIEYCIHSNGTETCEGAEEFVLRLEVDDSTKARLADSDIATPQARALVGEIVERYCDNKAHMDICNPEMQVEIERTVTAELTTDSTSAGSNKYSLKIKVPKSARPLVEASLNDPEAQDGLVVDSIQGATSPAAVLAGTYLLALSTLF